MAIADDFASIQKRRLEFGHEPWPSMTVENTIPPNLQPYFWGSFPVAIQHAAISACQGTAAFSPADANILWDAGSITRAEWKAAYLGYDNYAIPMP